MADFLFEIGLEEVPARMIAGAQAELQKRVVGLLVRERLVGESAVTKSFSTPRRLAVLVEGVAAKQEDVSEELLGPSLKVAYKDGAPTAAAEAFAKKAGAAVKDLKTISNPKGEYLAATVKRAGRSAAEVIASELPKEIGAIYWAKSMYWRTGKPERFVRPVKWLLALLDKEIVPVEFAGVTAGNVTYGHRVLHGGKPIKISKPTDYLGALEAGKVIADVVARRQKIRKALDAAVRTVPTARWREDAELVETVVHLTEWPSVVLGNFEPEYLPSGKRALPEEVLVTVMRDHQKYFAVEDAQGKLAPHFLAVLNTETDAAGLAVIRHGNERVLRARFNDARFFWDTDQKIPLADRVEMLKAVTFQKDLGSYFTKTEAVWRLCNDLAETVAQQGTKLDRDALATAALLAKTDLTTELVKEFTELQGIVGGLYARAQGHGEAVAAAIYSQYQPASSEAAIPPTPEGAVLALADKINTIVDMFAIGLEPTGSKDPFALRRAANGVVKILAESGLPLKLSELHLAAMNQSSQSKAKAGTDAVAKFLIERVEFYLREVRGQAYDVVKAVLASGADDVRDAVMRAEALTEVRGSEDFLAVSAAFKRMKNILEQAAAKSDAADGEVKSALLTDAAEKRLAQDASALAARVEMLRSERQYGAALKLIATLRPQVDAFFDAVMVMAPEKEIRANRLALLSAVLRDFSRIADFSEIVS